MCDGFLLPHAKILEDLHQSLHRCVECEVPDHDVHITVVVKISDIQGGVCRQPDFQNVPLEYARPGLFQPHHGGQAARLNVLR